MPINFYTQGIDPSWATIEPEIPVDRVSPYTEDIMRVQAYYLSAREEGRMVVTDGMAVFEIDGNGSLKKVYPTEDEKKARKPLPKKPVLDMKLLHYELKDTLLHLMKGQPKIIGQEYIGCEQTFGTTRFRHNYERSAAENQRMYYINFNGKHLGVLQRFPHRKVTVYSQTDPKLRLVQRLFERAVSECLPEATVEVL